MAVVFAAPFKRKGRGPLTGEAAASALVAWARQPVPPSHADIFWDHGMLDAHTLRFVEWCLQDAGISTFTSLRTRPANFSQVHGCVARRRRNALASLRYPAGGCFNARAQLAQRFDRLLDLFSRTWPTESTR